MVTGSASIQPIAACQRVITMAMVIAELSGSVRDADPNKQLTVQMRPGPTSNRYHAWQTGLYRAHTNMLHGENGAVASCPCFISNREIVHTLAEFGYRSRDSVLKSWLSAHSMIPCPDGLQGIRVH